MNILLGLLPSVLVIGLFFYLTRRIQQQSNAIDQLKTLINMQETRCEALQNDLSALCSGALGVDSRVSSNEQRVRSLVERLEELETDENRQGDQVYKNAIEMAQQGSSPEDLIEKFELTRDEADLLIRLYQLER